jgi:hypothetical protein
MSSAIVLADVWKCVERAVLIDRVQNQRGEPQVMLCVCVCVHTRERGQGGLAHTFKIGRVLVVGQLGDEGHLLRQDLLPADVGEERVRLDLGGTGSLFRIQREKLIDEILGLGRHVLLGPVDICSHPDSRLSVSQSNVSTQHNNTLEQSPGVVIEGDVCTSAEDVLEDLLGRITLEWRNAHQKLVEHHAQGPPINREACAEEKATASLHCQPSDARARTRGRWSVLWPFPERISGAR